MQPIWKWIINHPRESFFGGIAAFIIMAAFIAILTWVAYVGSEYATIWIINTMVQIIQAMLGILDTALH